MRLSVRTLSICVCAISLACASPGPRPPAGGLDEEAARVVLARFARALDRGDFDEAHALLSARWRSAYTPGGLAVDFAGAGPVATEAVHRVLAALATAGLLLRDAEGRARLPLGAGAAAVLVPEAGAWRVDALE